MAPPPTADRRRDATRARPGSSLRRNRLPAGPDAREQLIGRAADPEPSSRIRDLLEAQPEIDSVAALLTMQLGLDSTLAAARVDLVPGLDSEEAEETAVRIKRTIADTVPEADQVFLDVTDARAHRRAGTSPHGQDTHPEAEALPHADAVPEAAESPAATGERGGA
jgi:hypothetical protein